MFGRDKMPFNVASSNSRLIGSLACICSALDGVLISRLDYVKSIHTPRPF